MRALSNKMASGLDLFSGAGGFGLGLIKPKMLSALDL
jgi:hypothetical protein